MPLKDCHARQIATCKRFQLADFSLFFARRLLQGLVGNISFIRSIQALICQEFTHFILLICFLPVAYTVEQLRKILSLHLRCILWGFLTLFGCCSFVVACSLNFLEGIVLFRFLCAHLKIKQR